MAHLAKGGSPTAKQRDWFSGLIQCSWVLNANWHDHQRLELENDLIAAYLLSTGRAPRSIPWVRPDTLPPNAPNYAVSSLLILRSISSGNQGNL